jgi:hypothetical protein
MDYQKSLKVLPSFLSSCAQGHTNFAQLRANIQQVRKDLDITRQEDVNATHSKSFLTPEAKEISRRITQIDRFLESIQGC